MTTANTTAQIATFLDIAPNAIKSVTEMAWVFCVVVKGCRARFVSKKVVKQENVKVLKLEQTYGGDAISLVEIKGEKKVLILREAKHELSSGGIYARDITTQVKGKSLAWMQSQHFDTFHNVPYFQAPLTVQSAYFAA